MDIRGTWEERLMRHHWLWIATLILATAFGENLVEAQVSYSVIDSIYMQDFDSLPNTPNNASMGNSPVGWTDDNASPATAISASRVGICAIR
jgi:hypothetical protein